MLCKLFIVVATINVVFCAPQFITYKDGKIGVNFGGYNAQAGLGGLLTGNAAHGGLSASAGTPFGQNAAAGLGGALNEGRTYGGAYAGAQANSNVKASARLGGNLEGGSNSEGVLGAEAQSFNKHSSVYKSISPVEQPPVAAQGNLYANTYAHTEDAVVQKIKPPKKYAVVEAAAPPSSSLVIQKDVILPSYDTRLAPVQPVTSVETVGPQKEVFVYRKHVRPLRRRYYRKHYISPVVYAPQPQTVGVVEKSLVKSKRKEIAIAPAQEVVGIPAATGVTYSGSAHANVPGGFFDSIFNIPISTLRAVNDFLNTGVHAAGNVAIEKRVQVHHN